jgi:hypothetical protein
MIFEEAVVLKKPLSEATEVLCFETVKPASQATGSSQLRQAPEKSIFASSEGAQGW